LKQDYSQAYFDHQELWATDAWRTHTGDLERARLAERWLPDEVHSVVDVGCGNGVYANIEKEGRLKIGIDLSKTALGFLTAPAAQANAVAIPFPNEAFDASLSMEMLEHMPDPTYRTVLSELKRVTRRYILISVPYNEQLQYNSVVCPVCGKKFHPYGHLRTYKIGDMGSVFSDQFDLVKCKPVIPTQREALSGIWNLLRSYQHRQGRNFPNLVTCPQCGYSAGKGQIIGEQGTADHPRRMKLSRWWPKRSTYRWWLALYRRNNQGGR
jgi:SAM-dependent methyltransferase